MRREFDELYSAVFSAAETYIEVVRLQTAHKNGLTRKEIGEGIKTSGTNLTRIIGNLEKCSFIGKRAQFGNKKNEAIYRLIDFYTLFYFKFIENNLSLDNMWWTRHLDSSGISAWQGLSFELICMEHHRQIKNALGISGMATSVLEMLPRCEEQPARCSAGHDNRTCRPYDSSLRNEILPEGVQHYRRL